MGLRFPSIIFSGAKNIFNTRVSSTRNGHLDHVPKGHVAVYVGEAQKKRFVVPLSYLKHPSFQALLIRAEEEFGFNHPMGGLTIPCREDTFLHVTSTLHSQWF